MTAVVVILGALAVGDDSEAVRVRMALEAAALSLRKTTDKERLDAARAEAVASGRPLVVGVKAVLPRDCPEWVSVQVDSLDGYRSPCVVVAIPKGGGTILKSTIDGRLATRTDIFQALGLAPAYPAFRRQWNPDTQPTFQPYWQRGARPPQQSRISVSTQQC